MYLEAKCFRGASDNVIVEKNVHCLKYFAGSSMHRSANWLLLCWEVLRRAIPSLLVLFCGQWYILYIATFE